MLTDEEKEIFTAYAYGINRYLKDVVALDPANKVPYEFTLLGVGIPDAWTYRDVVANVVYQAHFAEVGGTERRNQKLLSALIAPHSSPHRCALFNAPF